MLGYPIALVMVRSNALVMRVMTIVVIAPLIVSVVVRTYGWQFILANTRTGVLNWILLSLGIIHQPLRILYSETAVIIGSLHVFFPMMVLPLASALAKINPGAGRRRAHSGRAVLAGVLAGQPAAQPARTGGRFHPGVLADRKFLRHACHTRRHRLPKCWAT